MSSNLATPTKISDIAEFPSADGDQRGGVVIAPSGGDRRIRLMRGRVNALPAPQFEPCGRLENRLSIAVQLLFSALNNEMTNQNFAFNISDPRFRDYLASAFDHLAGGASDSAPSGAEKVRP